MEFVHGDEVKDLLQDYRIKQADDGDLVRLRMDDHDDVVRIFMRTPDSSAEPDDSDAEILEVDAAKLPESVEGIVHRLHLDQVLLLPLKKWRDVFDAVAFSLADNEDWQDFEATASVELNTRDPLLCTPADFHTLRALIEALLADAESSEQGMVMITTAAPLLVEVQPPAAVRLSFGNQVLADEVADVIRVG